VPLKRSRKPLLASGGRLSDVRQVHDEEVAMYVELPQTVEFF
jgi:hypothetical protein